MWLSLAQWAGPKGTVQVLALPPVDQARGLGSVYHWAQGSRPSKWPEYQFIFFFQSIIFQLHNEGINVSLFYKINITAEVKPSISVYLWRKLLLSGHVCPSDLIGVYVDACAPSAMRWF